MSAATTSNQRIGKAFDSGLCNSRKHSAQADGQNSGDVNSFRVACDRSLIFVTADVDNHPATETRTLNSLIE